MIGCVKGDSLGRSSCVQDNRGVSLVPFVTKGTIIQLVTSTGAMVSGPRGSCIGASGSEFSIGRLNWLVGIGG